MIFYSQYDVGLVRCNMSSVHVMTMKRENNYFKTQLTNTFLYCMVYCEFVKKVFLHIVPKV